MRIDGRAAGIFSRNVDRYPEIKKIHFFYCFNSRDVTTRPEGSIAFDRITAAPEIMAVAFPVMVIISMPGFVVFVNGRKTEKNYQFPIFG